MVTLQFRVSEAYLKALNYERYHYPDPLCQKRLHANSVAICLKAYQRGGIEALKTNNYGTNKSIFEDYATDLLSAFENDPPRPAAEAAERLCQMTGLRRSAGRARAFMKRHGLVYRKCGHIPAKADPQRQQQWVETELNPAIEAAREGKIHLLFSDAAHFVLHPFICFLWSAVVERSAGVYQRFGGPKQNQCAWRGGCYYQGSNDLDKRYLCNC